ncbi:MAG: hypothetical protein JRH10_15635 [Deltaproteobacteria bacterium]|nr:hypothetical protein [Deltaproteobacteria bacterium]
MIIGITSTKGSNEQEDLVGVDQDPADVDGLAGQEDLEVAARGPLALRRGCGDEPGQRAGDPVEEAGGGAACLGGVTGGILIFELDVLDVVEDRGVDLLAREPIGHEAGGDQRALLVSRNEAAEDERRVLSHDGAQRVGLGLGLRDRLHQEIGGDRAVGLDLDDARAAVGDGPDLVVVHRVGRVLPVEHLRDLGGLEILELLFEFFAPHFAGLGLAVVADAIDRLGDRLDLLEPLGREDRAVAHDHGHGHERGASELLRELVLGVDERMVGPERAGLGVDADDRAGQVHTHAAQDRVGHGVKEEERQGDERHRPPKTVLHDPASKAIAGGIPRVRDVLFGHASPWHP